MIDQDLLDRLKPACARILRASDRALCGTGYLVSSKFVATCYHVVSSLLDQPLVCRFGDVEVWERSARVIRWDSKRDTALLEIEEPDPSKPAPAKPVVVEPAGAQPAEWCGYGYPEFAEFLGIPLAGQVLDAHTVDKDGRPALCLWVNQFAGALPESVGGFSGTPVLAGKRLLGQLFRVLGAEDGWQKPHLAICYATPAWAVAGLMAASGSSRDAIGEMHPPQSAAAATPPSDLKMAERLQRYETGAEALAALHTAGNPREVRRVLEGWDATGLPPEQGILLAAELLLGMAAVDDALQVLEPVADTVRGQQLSALAFSLQGNHVRAQALLRLLPSSEETAGITGGILKRRWLQEGRRNWLVASHEVYRSQNDIQPSAYLAVNVAALALQLGDEPESQREATRAKELVLTQPDQKRTHWDWASLAEAELLLGDLAAARHDYQRAAALVAANARDIAVMRRQARLDLAKMGRPRDARDDVLPVGGVACVIGAPLDDGAWTPECRARLRQRMAALLRDRQVVFGFASATRGADLLFIEALLDIGATPSVFLPAPREEFEAGWVGPSWRDCFRRIPAERVQIVKSLSDDRPFSGADAEVLRAAVDMGKRLDETPLLVAVPPPPGTADARAVLATVESWKQDGCGKVELLSIA